VAATAGGQGGAGWLVPYPSKAALGFVERPTVINYLGVMSPL